MKVKDLIKELEKLDQEKGIWISYDYPCALLEPVPDSVADEDYLNVHKDKDVKVGDYIITAW